MDNTTNQFNSLLNNEKENMEEVTDYNGKNEFLGEEKLQVSDTETEIESDKLAMKEENNNRLVDKLNENNAEEKLYKLIDSESSVEELQIPRRIAAFADSETDDEIHLSSKFKKKLKTFKKRLVISDSDDEAEAEELQNLKNSSKMATKISALIDTDSSQSSDNPEPQKIVDRDLKNSSNIKNKISALIDTESSQSSDNADKNESEEDEKQKVNIKNIKKTKKPHRASAKKDLDHMMTIQSEQQRLHREAHIKVPYHKPKIHSLQDFLKRRTINKPSLDEGTDGKSTLSTMLLTKSPKMTNEELEVFAKLMEERAEEATEFFKSESESDEEMHANLGVHDKTLHENENEEQMQENELESKISDEADKQIEEKENNLEEKAVNEIKGMQENVFETETSVEFQPAAMETANETNKQNEEEENFEVTIEEQLSKLPEKPMILEIRNLSDTFDTAKPMVTKEAKNWAKIEKFKQVLSAKQLNIRPTIQGTPDALIDLDSGEMLPSKPTGVDKLIQRFVSTQRKSDTNKSANIVPMQKKNIEFFTNDDTPNKEQKLEKNSVKFQKEDLKNLISQKRMEKIAGLLNKQLVEGEEKNFSDEEDDETYIKKTVEIDDEEISITDQEAEKYVESASDDNEESVGMDEEKKSITNIKSEECIFYADEFSESDSEDVGKEEDENDIDEEDKEENSDIENIEDEYTKLNSCYKKKNRIIKAFTDDSDDDIDLLKTQTQPEKINDYELCLDNSIIDENQPINYIAAVLSQIPTTQTGIGVEGHEDELMELCSGTFGDSNDLQVKTQTSSQAESHPMSMGFGKIFSSDEESKENLNVVKKVKKLRKIRAKLRPLVISDDDDDEHEDDGHDNDKDIRDEKVGSIENEEVEEEGNNQIEENEEAETFVDYDSEENEITVKLTKNEFRQKVNGFVENEAELSESEWGSADEDEKNLDHYDVELGDEDEFDRDKLKQELAQIHARKMLDDDQREVRKLQELYFEDGEADGEGRQRRFKWKNAEGGFSLDDRKPEDENGAGAASDEDENNEHHWRKIRFEREQLLQENGVKLSLDNEQVLTEALKSTNKTKKIVESILSINDPKTQTVQQNTTMHNITPTSGFLIPKVSNSLHKKTVRSSFLARDWETLSKIVGLKKTSNALIIDDENDETTTVTAVKQTKNFVFATLTAEEHEVRHATSGEIRPCKIMS